MAIQSFRGDDAEAIFVGLPPSGSFPVVLIRMTRRKLEMLHAATRLDDLRLLPGVRGDRQAIRVSGPYRLRFAWSEAGPQDVEFVDQE